MAEVTQAPTAPASETRPYWDPLAGSLSAEAVEAIRGHESSVKAEYDRLQQDPGSIRKNLVRYVLIALAVFVAGVALLVLIHPPLTKSTELLFALPFMGALPLGGYMFWMKKLQQDMVELMVADRFTWLFDPAPDSDKWRQLATMCPEVFNKGNRAQYIDNQFWGFLEDGQRGFWLGRFNYTVGHDQSEHTYRDSVYTFELKHPTPVDFSLVPPTTMGKLEDLVTSKGISTEATEFNKRFHIQYKGDRGLVGADIFQVLSPDVQEALVQFKEAHHDFRMVFSGAGVFVVLRGDLKVAFTNFRKSVALDERDASVIQKAIDSSVALADKMLPCLDRMAS